MSLKASKSLQTLQSVFKGDLVFPEDPTYPKAIARWAFTAERNCAVVAFVKDEADIAAMIKFAVSSKLEIAVKGGGHNVSGASSSEGGVVIDLSRHLNHVKVDNGSKVAYVGGGALWSDVDRATFEFGLATVCGTVSNTGVGGLTVGGGYGYLSGERGLVIDCMIGATIVTADGSTVHASQTENADLFWAVRGGGVNFGVVSTFEFECYPQAPMVFFGDLIFPGERLPEVLVAADKWEAEMMSPKDLMLVVLTYLPDHGLIVIISVFHNGSVEAGTKQYQAFINLGPVVNTIGEQPYLALNDRLNSTQAHGRNVYMSAATQWKKPHTVATPVLSKFKSLIELDAEKFATSYVAFEYIPSSSFAKKPSDSTAFNCRGYHSNCLTAIQWKGEKKDMTEFPQAKKWAKEISSILDTGEGNHETPYGNYEGDQVVGDEKVKKLFGSNYPRLRKIKARYDPDLVFGKWFPIQPAA